MKVDFARYKPQGHKFHPQSESDLTGQCAWFAQQITDCVRPMGSPLSVKKETLRRERNAGRAFYHGEEVAKVGYTAVMDVGAYGHVWVVNNVDDHHYTASESNPHGDTTVFHNRKYWISDENIIGFFRSIPYDKYIVKKPKYEAKWVDQWYRWTNKKLELVVLMESLGEKPLSDLIIAFRADPNVTDKKKSVFGSGYGKITSVGANRYLGVLPVEDVHPRTIMNGVYREDFGLATHKGGEYVTSLNIWHRMEYS